MEGNSNCAADAPMLLISLTFDSALNAKLREPQRLHPRDERPPIDQKSSTVETTEIEVERVSTGRPYKALRGRSMWTVQRDDCGPDSQT